MEINSPALTVYKKYISEGMNPKAAASKAQIETGYALKSGSPLRGKPDIRSKTSDRYGATIYDATSGVSVYNV